VIAEANKAGRPTVSFIMPVYNCEVYLAQSLDSIRAQTFEDWELIAVDDCSTDGSMQMLKAYERRDPRIRAFRQHANRGVGGTLDRAVGEARGELIARMDGNDVAHPQRLEWQVAYLREHPEVVAVGGQVTLVRANGEAYGTKTFPTDPDTLYSMMYLSAPIQHPTLVVNRALLPNEFTWFDGWPCGEDSNLFFKLVQYGKIANIPQFVLSYRTHSESNLNRNIRMTFKNTYRARKLAIKKYGYRATWKGRLVNRLQFIVIHILPERMIPRTFELFRRTMLRPGLGSRLKYHSRANS